PTRTQPTPVPTRRSSDLHAEMLLRHLGKHVRGDGSDRGGIAAEKEFLHGLGLDSAAFDLRDGCGLSHLNRVRTREMTLLLARMADRKSTRLNSSHVKISY